MPTIISKISEQSSRLSKILSYVSLGSLMILVCGTWIYFGGYEFSAKYGFLFVGFSAVCQVFILIIKRDIKRWSKKECIISAVAILIAAINVLFFTSGMGSIFTVFNFILWIFLWDKAKISKLEINIIGIIYIIVFIAMLASINYPWNPNTRGTTVVFSLFAIAAYAEVGFGRYRITKFLVLFIEVSVIIYILTVTHGRGILLGMAAYVFIKYLMPKRFWGKTWVRYLISLVLSVGSIVFVALYTWLGYKAGELGFSVIQKPLFTGRESIWLELWELFKGHYFTGIGTAHTLQSYTSFNLHNAMYSILIVHGIIVFILMVYLFVKKMSKMLKYCAENRVFRIAMAGFIGVLAESFTDMDLLWTVHMPLWIFLFLVMNSVAEERNHIEEKSNE